MYLCLLDVFFLSGPVIDGGPVLIGNYAREPDFYAAGVFKVGGFRTHAHSTTRMLGRRGLRVGRRSGLEYKIERHIAA
jgi:hypothetical protein